ncbi:unnamed protein product [Camellia sinensis]
MWPFCFRGGSLDGPLPISFSATTQLHSSSFTFATLTPRNNNLSSDNESSEEEPKGLCWRIEKLPRTEPVGSAFQSWMGDGFPIHRAHVFHTINRFRKLHFNKRALEVMEWAIRERPYRPKELDYSYLLEFRTKLHGLLYNNLVIACLDKGMIRLSLTSMKKMRELGHPISHLIFNRLIILHSSPNHTKAISRILRQMRADKVDPHVSTYNIVMKIEANQHNIVMKIEANQHNIEGLVKVFGDMKRAQVEPKEIFFCILATAHAMARLYTVCESYVEAVEKSATGNNWSTLDVLLLEALKTLDSGNDLSASTRIRKSTSWLEITLSIVEIFAENGDIENAEKLFEELKKANYTRYTFVYNTLIKAYVKHSLNSMSARNESQKQFGSYDNKQTHVRAQKAARMPSGATVGAAIVEAENSLETDYDLDLFNIVAIPDFNMGAMENKSLNIFNSKLVLASPETATNADYASIFGVIGHEEFSSDLGSEGVGQVFPVWNTDDARGNIKIGAWEGGIFKRIWGQPKTLFLRLWIKCYSTTRGGDAKTLDPRWRLLLA